MPKRTLLCDTSIASGAKKSITRLSRSRHQELVHPRGKLTDILHQKLLIEIILIGLSIEKNGGEPVLPIGKIPALRRRGHRARVGDAGEERCRLIYALAGFEDRPAIVSACI
jgi:hypothetical protein